MRSPSQLSTSLINYQPIFRIYAAIDGLGGGAKSDFVPRRGKP